jgi:5-methylcytosine-specific restriction endonuclease McrA
VRGPAVNRPGRADERPAMLKIGRRRRKHGECPLCLREAELTFHHLIPRKLHRRPFYRKHFSRETLNTGIDICRLCHDGIHDLYDEKRLARDFASVEALSGDEALRRHFQWVGKQKPGRWRR